jgi:hypothetical protein
MRVVDLTGYVDPLRVQQERLDLLARRAGHRQPRRHADAAERLERTQQHG